MVLPKVTPDDVSASLHPFCGLKFFLRFISCQYKKMCVLMDREGKFARDAFFISVMQFMMNFLKVVEKLLKLFECASLKKRNDFLIEDFHFHTKTIRNVVLKNHYLENWLFNAFVCRQACVLFSFALSLSLVSILFPFSHASCSNWVEGHAWFSLSTSTYTNLSPISAPLICWSFRRQSITRLLIYFDRTRRLGHPLFSLWLFPL